MRKSLFEMLAIADQERIHTQIIAWLLSPGSEALQSSDQSILIKDLFNLSIDPSEIKELKIVTELNNLDLALLHKNAFVVVENKLKSKQSDGQLEKYDKEINILKSNLKLNSKPIKFFLTFSGEESNQKDWGSIDYRLLHDSLVRINSKNNYVQDYILLLNKLTSYRDEFLKNHLGFLEVFKRSGMKSEERFKNKIVSANDAIKFICENKLERIFIETLYRKVALLANLKNVEINESHGTALIHIDFFIFKPTNSSHKFKLGYQLQGDSIKYVINAVDYKKSSKNWLPDDLIVLLDQAFPKSDFKSNSSKTKAYHSWSKKIKEADRIENLPLAMFSVLIKNQSSEAQEIWRTNLEQLKLTDKISNVVSLEI